MSVESPTKGHWIKSHAENIDGTKRQGGGASVRRAYVRSPTPPSFFTAWTDISLPLSCNAAPVIVIR